MTCTGVHGREWGCWPTNRATGGDSLNKGRADGADTAGVQTAGVAEASAGVRGERWRCGDGDWVTAVRLPGALRERLRGGRGVVKAGEALCLRCKLPACWVARAAPLRICWGVWLMGVGWRGGGQVSVVAVAAPELSLPAAAAELVAGVHAAFAATESAASASSTRAS